jgi:protein tyrosine phosphatase
LNSSAGVGRTGTYIAIDSLIQMIKAGNEINVFKFVNGLREQRILMVQRPVNLLHNNLLLK